MDEAPNQSSVRPIEELEYARLNVRCPVCEHVGLTRRESRVSGNTNFHTGYFTCTLCMPCLPYLSHRSQHRNAYHFCSYCGLRLARWVNDDIKWGYRRWLAPALEDMHESTSQAYDSSRMAISMRPINACQGTVPSPLGAPSAPPVTKPIPDPALPYLLRFSKTAGSWTIVENTCPHLTGLEIKEFSVPTFDAETNPVNPNVTISRSGEQIGQITFSTGALRLFDIRITTSYPLMPPTSTSREPRNFVLHVAHKGSWGWKPATFPTSQGHVEWETRGFTGTKFFLTDAYARVVVEADRFSLRFADKLDVPVVYEIITSWVAYIWGIIRASHHNAEEQRREDRLRPSD